MPEFSWCRSRREGAVDLYRCGVFFITSHYSAFVPDKECSIEFRWRLRVKHLLLSCVHRSQPHPSVTFSLTLLFSFPLPSGTGATAWMRCWVHGNWVGIDWTAAWPMRGQWEPEDQSSPTDCVSPHSAGKHKRSTTWGIRKWRNITILDNIRTSEQILFFCLLLALTLGPGRASFSIGCIIWLTRCIIWAELTVIFRCHVTTGERPAMSVCFAGEELMWKCLLRRKGLLPCQHATIVHMLNPLVLSPPLCVRERWGFENPKKVMLTGKEE